MQWFDLYRARATLLYNRAYIVSVYPYSARKFRINTDEYVLVGGTGDKTGMDGCMLPW